MSDCEQFFKTLWNEKAESDNIFVQMGRSNFSFSDFFKSISAITNRLELVKSDVLLDAGGGAGWFSIALSLFVKEVVLFDYSEKIIEKAKINIQGFSNIEAFTDDITQLTHIPEKQYSKVISGSTLQYLGNIANIELCLNKLFLKTKKGCKLYFTLNPDNRKKQSHLQSYSKLTWEKERIKKSLEVETMRLWTHPEEIQKIAKTIGFTDFREFSVNPDSWFSTHMYDFMLIK